MTKILSVFFTAMFYILFSFEFCFTIIIKCIKFYFCLFLFLQSYMLHAVTNDVLNI